MHRLVHFALAALAPPLLGAQPTSTIQLGGTQPPPPPTAASGTLARLRLTGAPSQTGTGAVRCAIGHTVDFQLEGLDTDGAPVALEQYAPAARSTDPRIVTAEVAAYSAYLVKSMCQGDGEGWIIVESAGVRTSIPVLAGTARSRATPSTPPVEAREIVKVPPPVVGAEAATATTSQPVTGTVATPASSGGTSSPRAASGAAPTRSTPARTSASSGAAAPADGEVVRTLNGARDAVRIVGGTGITVEQVDAQTIGVSLTPQPAAAPAGGYGNRGMIRNIARASKTVLPVRLSIIEVRCPAGMVVTGGGAEGEGRETEILSSRPADLFEGWIVTATAVYFPKRVTAFAVCVQP